jgi:phenylpropionate dioxygenase-like ring-hydroxylating dioxygenase large terminal subunit
MTESNGRRGVSPIPIDELARSAGDFADAIGLPPGAYTDRDFFDFEIEAVFSHEWLCVGRTDQIPNTGDFFTITMLGEPLIVVRGRSGDVNVMSSVCQHRAMCITAPPERPQSEWLELPPETSGNQKNFRCPYHWWIYDLDGRLIGAPEMARTNNFDRSSIRLPQLAVEVWQGFIFVNFDRDAPPISPRLAHLEAWLERYHVDEMVTVDPQLVPGLPFNWKIMVENFMEGYHPDRLHKGIHDFAPSSGVWYAPYQRGDAALLGSMQATVIDGGFNPTYRALFPVIPTLTEEERWKQLFVYVPPTLLMGFQPDSAFWFTVQPTAVDRHNLTMAYIFPPSTVDLPLFPQLLETAIHGVELFNNQDLPANTAIQVGMRSRFAPRGRYSWQEQVLSQFNTWLLERYEAHEKRATEPLTR